MKNADLKDFYNTLYKKGEKGHYTKLLFSGDKASLEKGAVLKEVSWKGKRVLDVGCGTGELAFLIAKKGGTVRGIDFAPSAIEEARKLHAHKNLAYECVDVQREKGQYDVVIVIGMLEHVDDPYLLLKKFGKLLAPGGSLIITAPNWANPRGIVLMALKDLFDAKITLADLHHFTPLEFGAWAKKLTLTLTWKTFDHEWGLGEKLIKDFERRLPKVLLGASFTTDQKKIDFFTKWLDLHKELIADTKRSGGAVGLYHFRKK